VLLCVLRKVLSFPHLIKTSSNYPDWSWVDVHQWSGYALLEEGVGEKMSICLAGMEVFSSMCQLKSWNWMRFAVEENILRD
jgi:hypothetical protein